MKAYLTALAIFVSASALADCPAFVPLYQHCESTNPSYSVQEVRVRSRTPYYNFSFWNQGLIRRLNVVTDGQPRDVTVQTQDGSEATYIETSSCSTTQLMIVRTSEESSVREETVLTPTEDRMKIHQSVDGDLKNVTTCYVPSF